MNGVSTTRLRRVGPHGGVERARPAADRHAAEVWTLNHLVTGLKTDGLVTTLHVVPQARGYEIIQFRRQMSSTGQKARIRFADDSGKTLAEWLEVSPGMYTDAR